MCIRERYLFDGLGSIMNESRVWIQVIRGLDLKVIGVIVFGRSIASSNPLMSSSNNFISKIDQ